MQVADRSQFVTLVLDLRFVSAHVNQAVQLLVSGVGRTEAKPGCRECLVARDAADEGHLRYSEAWDTTAALQRHLRSGEFRRVLAAMDMCREEPRVTIGSLTGQDGVAYLKELHDAEGGTSEGTVSNGGE